MHHLETLIQAIPPAVFAAGSAGDHPTASVSMSDVPASPIASFMQSHGASPRRSRLQTPSPDQLANDTARLSLSASYLYFDDEGYTRWQGEASGLPLLDLLVERHVPTSSDAAPPSVTPVEQDWLPNRTPRRTERQAHGGCARRRRYWTKCTAACRRSSHTRPRRSLARTPYGSRRPQGCVARSIL
ncbi:hypothetical protein C8R44DRAFT_774917 [Mycena epipterygia]|nr:hypothetical protein C8R44DRAFT_774917 [Mycena epipterygia]